MSQIDSAQSTPSLSHQRAFRVGFLSLLGILGILFCVWMLRPVASEFTPPPIGQRTYYTAGGIVNEATDPDVAKSFMDEQAVSVTALRPIQSATDSEEQEPLIRPYNEWDVRETAFDSLGRIGSAAVPSLMQTLEHENAEPPRQSSQALRTNRPRCQRCRSGTDEQPQRCR